MTEQRYKIKFTTPDGTTGHTHEAFQSQIVQPFRGMDWESAQSVLRANQSRIPDYSFEIVDFDAIEWPTEISV